EWSAVDDDGAMAVVVGADVGEIKTLGHNIIHLNGTHLPFAPDGVAYDKINLGTVETGFAASNGIVEVLLVGYLFNLFFSAIPVFCFSTVFFFVVVTKGETDIYRHIKRAKHQFS